MPQVKVTLIYECEGDTNLCISSLNDSHRPFQGRTESFSGVDGNLDHYGGRCISHKVEIVKDQLWPL